VTAFYAILLAGIGTYLMRASFLAILSDGAIPPFVERSLRYVGPAVFAAIVLPRVLGEPGLTALSASPTPEMLAIVVAAAAAWRSRNVPITLAIGMTALWLFQALGV
jgi:branched-subunit amino acid transport protein